MRPLEVPFTNPRTDMRWARYYTRSLGQAPAGCEACLSMWWLAVAGIIGIAVGYDMKRREQKKKGARAR